jgi:hypothetical protein
MDNCLLEVLRSRYFEEDLGKGRLFHGRYLGAFQDLLLACVRNTDRLLQFLFTIYLAFQITAAVYGTGRHRWDLTDEDARTSLLVSGQT